MLCVITANLPSDFNHSSIMLCVCVSCIVDANNAGSGELSIVVNNGSVPSSARMIAQNVYAVSFLPTEPGIYAVELFFNCEPLKGLHMHT